MNLSDILNETCVVPELKSKNKEDVIRELIEHLWRKNLIPDPMEAEKVVLERERLGSTGIGDGVAIPHGKLKNLKQVICALGVSREGVDFQAVDGKPVNIVFLVFAPEQRVSLHLEVLSKISRILRTGPLVKRILAAGDARKICDLIMEEEFNLKNERERS